METFGETDFNAYAKVFISRGFHTSHKVLYVFSRGKCPRWLACLLAGLLAGWLAAGCLALASGWPAGSGGVLWCVCMVIPF